MKLSFNNWLFWSSSATYDRNFPSVAAGVWFSSQSTYSSRYPNSSGSGNQSSGATGFGKRWNVCVYNQTAWTDTQEKNQFWTFCHFKKLFFLKEQLYLYLMVKVHCEYRCSAALLWCGNLSDSYFLHRHLSEYKSFIPLMHTARNSWAQFLCCQIFMDSILSRGFAGDHDHDVAHHVGKMILRKASFLK